MKKRRKVYRLKKKPKRVIFIVLIAIILILAIISALNKPQTAKNTQHKEIIKKEEKPVREQINSVLEDEPKIEENVVEEKVEEQEPPKVEISNTYTTRMTSFWANDGYGTGSCTGSGLCEWDFQVNDKGWYTYNGKLVVATATTYLANQGWFVADGVHLYKYWEELILTIDGVDYEAIILDSCGSSMRTDRVDLFVSNGSSAKDTMIQVRRK